MLEETMSAPYVLSFAFFAALYLSHKIGYLKGREETLNDINTYLTDQNKNKEKR